MLDEQLLDQTIRHQTFLESLKSREVNSLANILLELDRIIRRQLSGDELTGFGRTRLERQLSAINKEMAGVFEQYFDELSGRMTEIGEYEAGFEARSLNSAIEGEFEAAVPTSRQLLTAMRTSPLQAQGVKGQLLEPLIKDFGRNERKIITGTIRAGYAQGLTNVEVVRQLVGAKAQPGVLDATRRHASAIVRTSVQHAANVTRAETWKANNDVVIGYRWLSTLDSRTSSICRSLDGQVFKIGEGPIPPAHINCRSTTIAELDEDFAELRRGSTRRAKDEDGKKQEISAQSTYYEWLKRQPASYQNEILGQTRAKLFRDGGLSAEKFSKLQLDRNFNERSLQELRELEPLAFERANINLNDQ